MAKDTDVIVLYSAESTMLGRLKAMRDYLKEYGTFQQQKLAIAEEYAEKRCV